MTNKARKNAQAALKQAVKTGKGKFTPNQLNSLKTAVNAALQIKGAKRNNTTSS